MYINKIFLKNYNAFALNALKIQLFNTEMEERQQILWNK